MNPLFLKIFTFPALVASAYLSFNTIITQTPKPKTQNLPPVAVVQMKVNPTPSPTSKFFDTLDQPGIAQTVEDTMIEDFTRIFSGTNPDRVVTNVEVTFEDEYFTYIEVEIGKVLDKVPLKEFSQITNDSDFVVKRDAVIESIANQIDRKWLEQAVLDGVKDYQAEMPAIRRILTRIGRW